MFHLREVLSGLWKAALKDNPRKCHLGLTEAQYLGYCIGQGLLQPQEKKVEAIWGYPWPTTKKQVGAFLGLVGYYRRFVPNFSSVTSPCQTSQERAKQTWCSGRKTPSSLSSSLRQCSPATLCSKIPTSTSPSPCTLTHPRRGYILYAVCIHHTTIYYMYIFGKIASTLMNNCTTKKNIVIFLCVLYCIVL